METNELTANIAKQPPSPFTTGLVKTKAGHYVVWLKTKNLRFHWSSTGMSLQSAQQLHASIRTKDINAIKAFDTNSKWLIGYLLTA